MPKATDSRTQAIELELHAHAQQLLEFCRQNNLGFVVMLVEPSEHLHAVSNLTRSQCRAAATAWLAEPQHSSFHEPAGKA